MQQRCGSELCPGFSYCLGSAHPCSSPRPLPVPAHSCLWPIFLSGLFTPSFFVQMSRYMYIFLAFCIINGKPCVLFSFLRHHLVHQSTVWAQCVHLVSPPSGVNWGRSPDTRGSASEMARPQDGPSSQVGPCTGQFHALMEWLVRSREGT